MSWLFRTVQGGVISDPSQTRQILEVQMACGTQASYLIVWYLKICSLPNWRLKSVWKKPSLFPVSGFPIVIGCVLEKTQKWDNLWSPSQSTYSKTLLSEKSAHLAPRKTSDGFCTAVCSLTPVQLTQSPGMTLVLIPDAINSKTTQIPANVKGDWKLRSAGNKCSGRRKMERSLSMHVWSIPCSETS